MPRKTFDPQVPQRRITPFRHQKEIVAAPYVFRDVEWFFLCGGYGCGKSFSIVLCILDIVRRYNGHNVSVGIGSSTVTYARKTIWADLQAILKESHSVYRYNLQENILYIGTITFYFIATENPGNIYGYNLNIFLCDEIDELPQAKVLEANKAIRERTRLMLPDVGDGGRNPYIMYFTTVQGYAGLYTVLKNLKERGQRVVVVRGLTKDNTTLSKRYVQSLYKLYDENERQAYLEGKFVNLRAGRVYPDYDEETCTVDPFHVSADEIVYVGQDLNSGFSKGVAVVKRKGVLYIVRGWSFKEIGAAPAEMRGEFPRNRILWFPDTSGKEILKGYRDEIVANGIGCRIGTSNPRILDRVFYINKLFRMGLLKVCRGKRTEEVSEALKTRSYADNGMPEKGAGEYAPDHFCDSLEYVVYRLVKMDADFRVVRELSREGVREDGYIQIAERRTK